MVEQLKKEVFEANLELIRRGVVVYEIQGRVIGFAVHCDRMSGFGAGNADVHCPESDRAWGRKRTCGRIAQPDSRSWDWVMVVFRQYSAAADRAEIPGLGIYPQDPGDGGSDVRHD